MKKQYAALLSCALCLTMMASCGNKTGGSGTGNGQDAPAETVQQTEQQAEQQIEQQDERQAEQQDEQQAEQQDEQQAERQEQASGNSGGEDAADGTGDDHGAEAGQPDTEELQRREDGERFEAVINMEGMEETVQYEHIVNADLGIEMDYDYEFFVRESEPERECFVSVYDDPAAPRNYLEVTRSTEDAETAAAAVSEALSQDYELYTDSVLLDGAGSCVRIDASEEKGGGIMPELLQTVYIIPAADGCRIAAAHYSIESAEGFGTRFAYLVNTLTVLDSQTEQG